MAKSKTTTETVETKPAKVKVPLTPEQIAERDAKAKQKSTFYTRAASLLRRAHPTEFETLLEQVYADAGLTYVNRSKAKAEREEAEEKAKAERAAVRAAAAEENAKTQLEALFEKYPHLRPGAPLAVAADEAVNEEEWEDVPLI